MTFEYFKPNYFLVAVHVVIHSFLEFVCEFLALSLESLFHISFIGQCYCQIIDLRLLMLTLLPQSLTICLAIKELFLQISNLLHHNSYFSLHLGKYFIFMLVLILIELSLFLPEIFIMHCLLKLNLSLIEIFLYLVELSFL